MAIDPQQLTPTALTRLLNSTSLGSVINDRQLRRHRNRAGFRIGDGRHVDLYRYVAWLVLERHSPTTQKPSRDYEAMKEAARARNAALSQAGRDIGDLPEVVDAERKRKAESDFRFFCETYFPETFHLEWSPDHLKVMRKIEQAVLHGGLFAMAMPRGSGKTSLCETACLWAILFGHREFVCLIGSDEKSALEMLESIKMELDSNDLLLEDFPDVVYPIQKLDGIAHRANGQLYRGERTHIGWTAKEIVLPTIPACATSRDAAGRPDRVASGAIIRVAGITGRIRGLKYKRPDGRTVRPSLVIIDDPQTDESARSPSQCQNREAVLAGAVLGLAGPGHKIAGVMPCTVISKYDMADNILDRDKHPQWQGERTKMLYSFPKNDALWSEYEQIRATELKSERGLEKATAFYREHQVEMDDGALVAWEARHNPDEASAIQHAMNLKFQDERAFFAEYQNEPLDVINEEGVLTADAIAAKLNNHPRALVPLGSSHLTAFIDVQQKLLYYTVAAWDDDFTGYVIDYGAWPDPGRAYFSLRDVKRTLARATPNAGLEGSIYAGLEKLTVQILGREWRRDDGAMLRIERCLVDANWGESTDVVYQFCRQSNYASVLMPSHGRYVGAASVPMSEYKRKPGERVGHNWRIPSVRGKRAVRHVLYDTNYWKSFIHARLAVPMGDKSCLSLWGNKPLRHRLFSEHLTAEYCIPTEARGRTVNEWKAKPSKADNHWFDCLVGCAVAAGMCGITLESQQPVHRKQKGTRMSFSAMQRKKQQERRREELWLPRQY